MRYPLLAFALSTASLGCGGGQTRGHPFDSAWHDEGGQELAAFVARWKMPAVEPPLGAFVGVIEQRALVGGLFGAPPWRVEVAAEGQPILVGKLALVLGGGFLHAFDVATGERVWRLPALGVLRGASDDGVTTLVSIESLSGLSTQVLDVARNGTVVRQIVEQARIGSPVVIDEFAFLPVAGRSVIVFDLITGDEAARVVARVPLTRAFLAGDELYVGGDDVVRFDASIANARHGGGTHVRLPTRLFPGGPSYRPVPEGGPLPRAQLVGLPSSGELASLAYVSGTWALGLQPKDASVSWVHRADAKVTSARAVRGGFVLCDAHGDVTLLDAEGHRSAHHRTGVALDRCDATAPSVNASAAPADALPTALARALEPPAVEDLDVQLFLVDELARTRTPEADRALDALAHSPEVVTDSPDRRRAREARTSYAKERLGGTTRSPGPGSTGVE